MEKGKDMERKGQRKRSNVEAVESSAIFDLGGIHDTHESAKRSASARVGRITPMDRHPLTKRRTVRLLPAGPVAWWQETRLPRP